MAAVAVAALGTRGDVQPLALVAWQLTHSIDAGSGPLRVTLITHAAHEAWLQQLFGPSSAVQLLLLASSPAGVWQAQQQQQQQQQQSQGGGNAGSSKQQQPQAEDARQQLLHHCRAALGMRFGGDAQPPAPQQPHARLLAFNLFALEGFHIAEALQVPCLVMQPYQIPYTLPGSFARRFARACPGLAAALQRAADLSSDSDRVSWKDVSSWAWPLWTERWGAWRQEGLGLSSAWPLLQAWQEGWQGCTFKGAPQQHDAPDSGGLLLPESVPVLYGLSPSVVVRPGFWPASVQLTGFWLASDLHQQPQWQQQQQQQSAGCRLPAALQDFLLGKAAAGTDQQQQQQQQQQQGADTRTAAANALAADTAAPTAGSSASADGGSCVLLVDFGSMGLLGLLRDASTLVGVIVAALEQLRWRGVLLTGGWAPLQAACTALGPPPEQLFVQHEPLVCHHLLLASVHAVLHHGGSGTTAASLAAGTPQLLCPLQFDQFYWAERVADLGCSPGSRLTAEQLMPSDSSSVPQAAALLAAQVQAARQPRVLACCRSLQQDIAAERGLHTAAGVLRAQLQRQSEPCSAAGVDRAGGS